MTAFSFGSYRVRVDAERTRAYYNEHPWEMCDCAGCRNFVKAAAAEDVPAEALLRHLLNGLYALSTLSRPLALIKAAFELKFLCVAGFAPLADSCAYCGRADPSPPMLDTVQGVLHCRDCAPGNAGNSVPLCAASLAALRHVVYGDDKRLYSFRLGADALKRLSDASERFLCVQMERRFRTLEFYKSLSPEGMP